MLSTNTIEVFAASNLRGLLFLIDHRSRWLPDSHTINIVGFQLATSQYNTPLPYQNLAHSVGIEPTTYGLEIRCSIH